MSDLSITVGQLIRNARLKKEISQEKLALICDIDRSYLGRIERGKVNITIEKLYELATALEMDAKDLLP
ncbi:MULTISPECIES: helix-turn-helix domain-containing protein [Acinetobacter]|jgi:transcriptional regulator with XRE-family HTH domain|uniref:helix-turn-helix domain-containing protein n=1 Tax=Acinetobacter TaxID=469 RepID=UPI000DD00375|nr:MULTISPECIES: helix-turn-helix transcriptional regulator [Acinetobacter]RZG70048.1 XRE family transcriptional regulator [Acinetobacter junii]TPS25789.1 helix-turn-helix transcriptional regulator [Acinetobacter baumannii]